MPITMIRAGDEKRNVGLYCCPMLHNILYNYDSCNSLSTECCEHEK